MQNNVNDMTEDERISLGIEALPKNLWEAIQITEKSNLVQKALGNYVFSRFIENKKIEWENYRSQVTDYEINRYLSVL